MGYTRHHAILVTTFYEPYIQEAHRSAVEIFGHLVSEINFSRINGFCSFAVFPDGSKEGWPDSDQGDANRERFKAWLNAHQYENGSSPYDWVWVEMQYGDDRLQTRIVADSDEQRRTQQDQEESEG